MKKYFYGFVNYPIYPAEGYDNYVYIDFEEQ